MRPNSLNALQAWLLAFTVSALPACALGYGVTAWVAAAMGEAEPVMFGPDSLMIAWLPAGLIGAAFIVRPIENFIRRQFYDLASVEQVHGTEAGDAVSEAAEQALADTLREELGRKPRR